MSQVIAGEAGFFLASFFLGVCILFAYDILKSFRKGIPHSGIIISAEDFLFWCAAGVAVFGVAYQKNSGNIRGFALAALVFGMLLYYQTVSPRIVKIFTAIFGGIYRAFAVVCCLILSPAGKSAKKVWKIVQKALKNRAKEVRIIIRKNKG